MRIILLANSPFAPTGYGVQTRLAVPRFWRMGHPTAVCSYYGLEGGIIHWTASLGEQTYSVPLYGRAFHPYGLDVIAAHGQHWQADIIMTLMDAWVVDPKAVGPRWVPWLPVDHEPLPYPVVGNVAQSYQPIVYSKSAVAACQDAGLDVRYVPHAVDTQVFAPLDRKAAREALGWPQDRFIAGIVAMNKGIPSRKAFDEQILGFSRFARQHGDAMLYLHTHLAPNGENGGQNIRESCEDAGLDSTNVFACDQYQQILGYPDDYMAKMYSAFDVLLAVTKGEGFGIPILESQACGTPVITGSWTAMRELCFAGWQVAPEDALPQRSPQMRSYQFVPNPDAIAELLECAYTAKDDAALREKARQGALPYDADVVAEQYWRPVLAELAERVEAEK